MLVAGSVLDQNTNIVGRIGNRAAKLNQLVFFYQWKCFESTFFCKSHAHTPTLTLYENNNRKTTIFQKSWQSISLLYFGYHRHRPIKINNDPPAERKHGNGMALLSNRMYLTIGKRMFSSIKKLKRKKNQFNSDFNSFDHKNSISIRSGS